MNSATLSVIISAVDKLTPELSKTEGKLEGFRSKVEQFSKGIGTAIKWVGAGVGALSGAVTAVTYSGAKFEKAFQNALTMLDGTQKELDQVRDSISELAQKYGASFEEISNALYSLGSAGVSAKDAVKVLDSTLKASTAGATDVNLAFQSAISIINAYGLSLNDLDKIYAMQFESVKKGLLTYEEFARDFSILIPAARNLGVSLRDAMAGYVALTTAGIRSSVAANAVEGAFGDLMQKASAFQKLGIDLYENGAFIGLPKLIEKLRDKMKELNDEQKSALLNQMGLAETATRAIMTWVNNYDKFKDVYNGIAGSAGALSDAFAKQTASVSFMIDKMKSAFQALQMALFQAIRPELMNFLTFIVGKLKDFTDMITKNAATIGPLIWSFLKFGGLLLGIMIPMKFVAETIRALAHPVTLIVLGITGAVAGLWKLQNKGKGLVDFMLWLGQIAEQIWNTLQKWGEEIGKLMDEKKPKTFWGKMVVFLEWLFVKGAEGFTDLLKFIGEKLLVFGKWLWEQFKNGIGELWDWIKEFFAWLGEMLFNAIVVPLVDAFQKIFGKTVDWMKDLGKGFTDAMKATGKGIATFGGWLIGKGWLWGKQEGGYTGDGAENQPAGIVHAGEYVIPAWMVKKYPYFVAILEQIRVRKYKQGGYVAGGSVRAMALTAEDSYYAEEITMKAETVSIEAEKAESKPEEKKQEWWDKIFERMLKDFDKFAEQYNKTFIAKIIDRTEQFKNAVDNFLISIYSKIITLTGGSTLGNIVWTLYRSITSLENISKLLDPITTILNAMMEVLEPILNEAFKPLVEILVVLGRTIGTLLLPLLEPLTAMLQLIAQVFVWLYNTILRPIAIGIYFIFGMVAQAFNVMYNVISDVVRFLTFGLVDIGKRAVKSFEQVAKEAAEAFPELKFEQTASQFTQQFTANVTRSGPEEVNVYVQISNSVVQYPEEKWKEMVVKAVRQAFENGTLVAR